MNLLGITVATKYVAVDILGLDLQLAWDVVDRKDMHGGPTRRQIHIHHSRLGYIIVCAAGIEIAKGNGHLPPVYTMLFKRGEKLWPSSDRLYRDRSFREIIQAAYGAIVRWCA